MYPSYFDAFLIKPCCSLALGVRGPAAWRSILVPISFIRSLKETVIGDINLCLEAALTMSFQFKPEKISQHPISATLFYIFIQ